MAAKTYSRSLCNWEMVGRVTNEQETQAPLYHITSETNDIPPKHLPGNTAIYSSSQPVVANPARVKQPLHRSHIGHLQFKKQQNYSYEVPTKIILWLGSLQHEELYLKRLRIRRLRNTAIKYNLFILSQR